jgi:hypothetical protein
LITWVVRIERFGLTRRLALERRTGGGRRREKDGDKAKKDQAKWDELLGLEDDTKTAEEVYTYIQAAVAMRMLPTSRHADCVRPTAVCYGWLQVLLLQNAERAAAGLPPIEQMPPPPQSEADQVSPPPYLSPFPSRKNVLRSGRRRCRITASTVSREPANPWRSSQQHSGNTGAHYEAGECACPHAPLCGEREPAPVA